MIRKLTAGFTAALAALLGPQHLCRRRVPLLMLKRLFALLATLLLAVSFAPAASANEPARSKVYDTFSPRCGRGILWSCYDKKVQLTDQRGSTLGGQPQWMVWYTYTEFRPAFLSWKYRDCNYNATVSGWFGDRIVRWSSNC